MKKLHKKIIVGVFILMSGLSIASLPVYAQDMASPPNSLVVDDTGNVGIRTAAPTQSLHIKDPAAQLFIENSNPDKANRVLYRLTNKGNVVFRMQDTVAPGTTGEWVFRTSQDGGSFVIGHTSSGVVEMEVFSGGNMTINGSLTQSSSKSIKENIVEANPQVVLARVIDLPINRWSYKHDGNKVRHIGPMSEDFHAAFGVGMSPKGIASIDTGGVALAAIKGLNELVVEKDGEITQLKTELEESQDRLSQLEATVSYLVSRDQVAEK